MDPITVISEQCLAVRLRSLQRAVNKIYEDGLRGHNLRISQANLLVVIARLGDARPADLCKRLAMDPSTLSRDVERMLQRGWITSTAGKDARTLTYRITPEGRALVEACFPDWQRAQEKAQAFLGESATKALLQRSNDLMRG